MRTLADIVTWIGGLTALAIVARNGPEISKTFVALSQGTRAIVATLLVGSSSGSTFSQIGGGGTGYA